MKKIFYCSVMLYCLLAGCKTTQPYVYDNYNKASLNTTAPAPLPAEQDSAEFDKKWITLGVIIVYCTSLFIAIYVTSRRKVKKGLA